MINVVTKQLEEPVTELAQLNTKRWKQQMEDKYRILHCTWTSINL
jgi:hypothetical protein